MTSEARRDAPFALGQQEQTMSAEPSEGVGNRRRNILVLLPLATFLALATLFYFRLGSGDPSRIPSALMANRRRRQT